MNPFPVVPTRAHPHVHSGWRHTGKASLANHASATIVNDFLFHVTLPCANELRCKLRLRTLRVGGFGGSMVQDQKVPISHMWSPALWPRPKDWPAQVDVTGFCFWEQDLAFGGADASAEPGPEQDGLRAWLDAGPPPILINWGSMVFDGKAVTAMCIEAARILSAGGPVRILLQSGASSFDASAELPPNVYMIGPISHQWLLPRVRAIVCHGGAGTVGAATRASLPMLATPFFGDQTFWSHLIETRGLGLQIPFTKLNGTKLAKALAQLDAGTHSTAVAALSEQICREDGLGALIASFHAKLPLASMCCDASALLGECRVARHTYANLKLSDDAYAAAYHAGLIEHPSRMRPHRSVAWDLGAAVRSPLSGLWSGVLAALWEVAAGLVGLLALPIRGCCVRGAYGGIVGLLVGLVLVLLRLLYAPIIAMDRIATGVCNGCRRFAPHPTTTRRRRMDHVMDPEPALTAIARLPFGERLFRSSSGGGHKKARATAVRVAPVAAEDEPVKPPEPRLEALSQAYRRIVALREVFDWCAGGGSTTSHAPGLSHDQISRLSRLPAEMAPLLELEHAKCAALAEELSRRLKEELHDVPKLVFSEFVRGYATFAGTFTPTVDVVQESSDE